MSGGGGVYCGGCGRTFGTRAEYEGHAGCPGAGAGASCPLGSLASRLARLLGK